MKPVTLLIATAASLLAGSALQAQHHAMPGVPQPGANSHAESAPALSKPVLAVFDSYIKIQVALAQDSMAGLSTNATAIAKSVQADAAKTLSDDVAKQAERLAEANDIGAARDAFKPLSDSLIKYLDANKAHRSHFVRVYCPMAKARWLQTGAAVNNPYFGKSMLRCGKIEG